MVPLVLAGEGQPHRVGYASAAVLREQFVRRRGVPPRLADALLGLPVTQAQCATVRELRWHTSSKAIALVWSEWGGECEEFHIRALDGISAALPGLEALHLELTEVTDLTPVTSCDRLRALTLAGGYDDETDLAPLAATRRLTSLALHSKRVEELRPLSGLPLEHLSSTVATTATATT
ncbi:hypothetical protein AB0M58_39670 [Streptomyces bobili]|uniref:DUF6892 domain-containing protein n=1 Tax=Streptomyces bobili TaxID=67280 RepID=UPI003420148F